MRVKLESSLSAKLPAPFGVPRNLEIDPVLFIVMVVSQLCLLLADDTKIGGSCANDHISLKINSRRSEQTPNHLCLPNYLVSFQFPVTTPPPL